MRYELKSIKLWAFVKVSFFVNLPIGFILGLLYAMMLPFMVAGMAQFGGFPGLAFDPSDFPIGVMMIILPILGAMFAAVFYTLAGVIVIAFYNLIRRLVGGLEFELDPVKVSSTSNVVRPIVGQTDLRESTVAPPSVTRPLAPSASPPPPPAVLGVAPTVPPTVAPVVVQPLVAPPLSSPSAPEPEEPATIVPALPPEPPTGTTNVSTPPESSPIKEREPDDKPSNDSPPAPGNS